MTDNLVNRAAVLVAIHNYLGILNVPNNHPEGYSFAAEQSGKNYRIVMQAGAVNGPRSVHAFVNADTGDLYKAAGWKAPNKDTRYNLLTDLDTLVVIFARDSSAWAGSYLYKSYKVPAYVPNRRNIATGHTAMQTGCVMGMVDGHYAPVKLRLTGSVDEVYWDHAGYWQACWPDGTLPTMPTS